MFTLGLSEALLLPSSDTYPFDSLKSLIIITSPDNKFRIFHWNLPTAEGRHRYYGFIKILDQQPSKVFPLVETSDAMTWPDTAKMDNLNWFGALYYKIIPCETASGSMIYTLLGWAGKNTMISQKVIEILFFDDLGRPHFGQKLFPEYEGGNMRRIIFRFSATTSISLKYENHLVKTTGRWNSKKRNYDYTIEDAWFIVFDRIVPLDPGLEGQYQYYVGSGDKIDGFRFNHHTWNYIEEIDRGNNK
jgi:hypothetical protein